MDKQSQLSAGALLAVGLGTLMTAFESSAVGAVLPTMVHAFHGTVQAGKFIVTGYLLALCLVLLPAGRLGDIFGYQRIYLVGLALSAPAALCCAMGNSLTMVAACRVIEGIGAAMVLANGIPIVTNAAGANKSGRLLGLLTTMAYAGLITGSLLSGWLLSLAPGWRTVFLASVLLSLISLSLSVIILPRDSKPAAGRRQKLKQAMLPSNGSLTAMAMLLLGYAGLYCMLFIFPFYLLDGLGIGKDKIGFLLAIRPVVTALLTPVSGILADRHGARSLSLLGMGILFLAFAIPLLGGGPWSMPTLILLLIGMGAGMGVFLAPNHTFIMQNSGQSFKGVASSTLSLIRNIGMLLGSALSGMGFAGAAGRPAAEKLTLQLATHSTFMLAGCIIGIALFIGLIDHSRSASRTLRPA